MMNMVSALVVVALLACLASIAGATVPQTMDAKDVIINSNILKSLDSKIQYLIIKAQEFVESRQYEDAKEVAEYVVTKLDGDSKEAWNLLKSANKAFERQKEIEFLLEE